MSAYFFQAEDGIRDGHVTGVQTCALPILEGEGTWAVDPSTGEVTFTPEEGFYLNPTPITYTVEDACGQETDALIVIIYELEPPAAEDDEKDGGTPGEPITVPVVTDNGTRGTGGPCLGEQILRTRRMGAEPGGQVG